LRILLDYRPALRQRTGVGEYVHEMAAALARRLTPSDRLLLFSSSWKDRLARGLLGGTDTIDTRVPVRVLNWAWHHLEWPPVERFAGAVDIAHSAHPLLMPSRGGRQVVTIYDLDFLDHPERTRAEIRRDYPRLAPLHARRAAAVVTISEFTAAAIVRRLGVARDRIVVCPPGAPRWTPRAQPVPRGPILFVGTLEPRKNVGALLKAYAMLIERDPSAPPLWIAGGQTEASGPWLRAMAEPPLAGHVKYLGYIQSDDRYALYVQSSMLILPSHLEGFGMTALEAMAAGVPTILSRRGALPEVAGDAAAFVEPDDTTGLAAAMTRYLESPAAAAEASERGLARAARFAWDSSADILLDRYRQIA
jgi:glycosyltransferase involved in cell wall biosynthesis